MKHTFTYYVYPSQVPLQWEADCPELDLVTQGDSLEHAKAMMGEAIQLVVTDDLNHGRDPLRRGRDPYRYVYEVNLAG